MTGEDEAAARADLEWLAKWRNADVEQRRAELKRLRAWVTAAALASAEQKLRRGDPAAILEGIYACAFAGMLPVWLCQAFQQAYRAVKVELQHASWDEVFDQPHNKNKKLAAARQDKAYRWAIYVEICNRRAQQPRKDHFAAVAAEYGISEALARKYYRKASRILRALRALRGRAVMAQSSDPDMMRLAALMLAGKTIRTSLNKYRTR